MVYINVAGLLLGIVHILRPSPPGPYRVDILDQQKDAQIIIPRRTFRSESVVNASYELISRSYLDCDITFACVRKLAIELSRGEG